MAGGRRPGDRLGAPPHPGQIPASGEDSDQVDGPRYGDQARITEFERRSQSQAVWWVLRVRPPPIQHPNIRSLAAGVLVANGSQLGVPHPGTTG